MELRKEAAVLSEATVVTFFAFESFCFHDDQPLGLLMPFRRCAVGPNLAAVEA